MIIQPQIIGSGGGSAYNNVCTDGTCFQYSSWQDLPDFIKELDTSQMTTMQKMFYYCTSVKAIDLRGWDVSNVTDMSNMFCRLVACNTIDLSGWDTSNVTDMNNMFYHYGAVVGSTGTNLYLGDHWDMGAVTNVDSMFTKAQNRQTLTNVTGTITDLGKAFTANTTLDLSYCPLTNASAMVFINGLYDLVSVGSSLTHTIKFSSTTYGYLSAADIAVATAKGWTVTS